VKRLRLTRSLDGVHRTEIRVGFRIDQTDLIKAILRYVEVKRGASYSDDGEIGSWSRDRVLRALRDGFREHGELGMISEVGTNVGPKTRSAAQRQVRALFPEFF
jgi:hypothetical protein